MAYRLSTPNIQFANQLGVPLAGGMLFFYVTGTNTFAPTYQDPALAVFNANPVVLDSAGYAGNIFLDPTQLYKVILTDVNGLQQWSIDPVSDPAADSQVVASSLTVSDASGAPKSIFLDTGTLKRWGLVSDGTPESGSNAGSNFQLNSYDDSGALLSNIFTINRATGAVNFAMAPTFGGQPVTPVGQIAYFPASSPPSGWLAVDGSTFTRTAQPSLSAFALASGNIVSDAAWIGGGYDGSFSSGDGSTTIRLPDYRGYFQRGWDNGRGLDAGRTIGSVQGDQLASHVHITPSPALPGTTGGLSSASGANQAPQFASPQLGYTSGLPLGPGGAAGLPIGNENRPKNLSALACIKT